MFELTFAARARSVGIFRITYSRRMANRRVTPQPTRNYVQSPTLTVPLISIDKSKTKSRKNILVIKSHHKRNMWICVGLKGQPLKKSSQFVGQSRSVVERKVSTSLGISILLPLRKRNILLLTQRFSFSSLTARLRKIIFSDFFDQ